MNVIWYVHSPARSALAAMILIAALPARAQSDLTPVEVYERCYLRMVRNVPAATDPILKKVAAGTVTGPAGCMELFDKAKFDATGKIANLADGDARAIVRTFHDFHGSWFQSRANPSNGQAGSAFSLLNDLEGPSLYLTRALFGAGARYDAIVKGSTTLSGVRTRLGKANLSPFEAQRILRYPADLPEFSGTKNFILGYRSMGSTEYTALTVPNTNIVEVGDLVGVKNALPFVVPSMGAARAETSATDFELLSQNVVVNRSYGGGIVGSSAFLFSNANLTVNVAAKDDTSINRVAAARVFEDLLCHQLPTLTLADVQAEQAELVKADSPNMFRRDKTCMQCHAQIDYFAYGYRNLVLSTTGANFNAPSPNHVGFPTLAFLQFPVNVASTSYHQSAPKGTLRYRGFRSTAVTRANFSSLEQLGEGLAASRDLYECAAKRYYKFFTGIDVRLDTLVAPAATAPEATRLKHEVDAQHQAMVIKIAARLKSGQSLRTLVSDIVSSPVFKSRNFQSIKETAP